MTHSLSTHLSHASVSDSYPFCHDCRSRQEDLDKLWWEEEAELQKGDAEPASAAAPAPSDAGDGWGAFMGRDCAGVDISLISRCRL